MCVYTYVCVYIYIYIYMMLNIEWYNIILQYMCMTDTNIGY